MTTRETLSHRLALALLVATAVGFYHYQKSAVIVPSLPGYLDSPSKREVRAAMARLQEPGPAASPAAPRLLAMVRVQGADAEGAISALSRIDLAQSVAFYAEVDWCADDGRGAGTDRRVVRSGR